MSEAETSSEESGVSAIDPTLTDFIGDSRVLDSASVSDRATSFWNHAPMQAKALLMPSSADDVAGILRHCNSTRQSVLTHGGLTNCVSAVEPSLDDLVLSTEKMTGIEEIDRIEGEMDRLKRQLRFVGGQPSGSHRDFRRAMASDPRSYHTRPEAVFAGFEAIRERVKR